MEEKKKKPWAGIFSVNDEALQENVERIVDSRLNELVERIADQTAEKINNSLNWCKNIPMQNTGMNTAEGERNFRLENENVQLRNQLSQMKQKYAENNAALQAAETQVEQVNSQNRLLKKQLYDANQEKTAWLKKIDELQQEVDDHKKEANENSRRLQKAQEECERLQAEKNTFQTACVEWQENYGAIERITQLYSSLSETVKQQFRFVFTGDTKLGIFVAGVQWDTIESIWNTAKWMLLERNGENLETLKQLFILLFRCYNKQFAEPRYQLICPENGERFDDDEQSILGSHTDGFISETILPGYRQAKNGRVLQKAFIRVREG